MRCDWRYESAWWARGKASALLRSTPSILTAVSCRVENPMAEMPYSKANAKSDARVLGAAAVCRKRRSGTR